MATYIMASQAPFFGVVAARRAECTRFRDIPPKGTGYLAGEYPAGITTVDGVPHPALVRAIYRPAAGALGDGVVAASTLSAVDGTWRIDGLDPSLRYDVVGRCDGFNDVIVSNVQPVVGP